MSQLVYAVASLRSGLLLRRTGTDADETLEALAATLPEIFGTLDPGCLERIAQRLGAEPSGQTLAEVLLLSENRVHVIQPLAKHPGQALLALSSENHSVGMVLSQVHARVAVVEDES